MTLELINVMIKKADHPLFNPVTFSIKSDEVVTLMGASGIGKSTLIDAITGQLDPAFSISGDIQIHGNSLAGLAPQARRIGVLYQDANLFPHMSIGQNIAFGLSPEVKGKHQRREVIEAALDDAGLSGFYHRDPSTLSGGQKTRVALLRTILARPLALCLDEPFAKLDPVTREEIKAFTFAFVKERQIATLLVTHDHQDASQKVLHLSSEEVT